MQPENPDQRGSKSSSAMEAVNAFFSYWLVSWIIVPVGLVVILHFFVFSAYHVVGTSMVPTLQDENYLIISKVSHTFSLIKRQDYIPKREQVIVFHYPKQPTLDFVKRVTGLPGDRVVVHNCSVTIYPKGGKDGFNPDTKHAINGTCTQDEIDTTVPDGNLFVLGDNRVPGGSSDSREWGFLPSNDIVGNVVLRLFPFTDVRTF